MYQVTKTFSVKSTGKIFYEEKLYSEEDFTSEELQELIQLEWLVPLINNGEIKDEQHTSSEWESIGEPVNGSNDANMG